MLCSWGFLVICAVFVFAEVRSLDDLAYPTITKAYKSEGLIIGLITQNPPTPPLWLLTGTVARCPHRKLDRYCHVVLADGEAHTHFHTNMHRTFL